MAHYWPLGLPHSLPVPTVIRDINALLGLLTSGNFPELARHRRCIPKFVFNYIMLMAINHAALFRRYGRCRIQPADQLGNVPRRQRAAEDIALDLLDLGTFQQQLELGFRLDAFGHDGHVEIAAEPGNIGQKAQRSLAIFDIDDEGPVDLELVERQRRKIAERGITGSKIIQRDADPPCRQLRQSGLGDGMLFNDRRFGDFDFETVR